MATKLKNLMVKSRTLTAVTTLTEADSGKTIFLNSATEFAVTLPKVKAGLNFQFVVKAAPSGANYTIASDSTDNKIIGQVYTVDVNSGTDPGFTILPYGTINFISNTSVVGDSVYMISDGTYWYARCFCSVYNAITFTVESSFSPSKSPSISPSLSPSKSPSISPSLSPSISPSISPST